MEKVEAWLGDLCSPPTVRAPSVAASSTSLPPQQPQAPRPNRKQRDILRRVIERCLQECEDEAADKPFRSEPISMLIHGVPGAGKSAVLKWLRSFFEDVCGFTHGVEFVFLASMSTMASIVEGCTLHSFGNIAFKMEDGT